jgi:hypothetical protein
VMSGLTVVYTKPCHGRVLNSMKIGELFMYGEYPYIITNSGPSTHGKVCCCSLLTGKIEWLQPDSVMVPIKATLNIYEQGPDA